ncbi:MAG: transglutaminase family protein [Pseudomonadales bacterium]
MPPSPTDEQRADILAALAQTVQSPHAGTEPEPHAEFEIALLIARIIDPDLVEAKVRDALAQLLASVDAAKAPWDALTALGFRGNAEHYEAEDNSAIHRVLAQRTGIPITLAVVLIEVAKARGLQAEGINYPGHFLVRIADQPIDPFALTPLAQVPDALPQMPGISPTELGLRMLNNLKYAQVRARVWHQALALTEYQLALLPEHPHLFCEQGEYWAELGAISAAKQSYQQALARTSDVDSGLRDKIAERLRQLQAAGSETLH